MDNQLRSNEHKKNQQLEGIFPEMEQILGSAENNILSKYSAPEKKVYLIVGCARSGSTLLYQYLACSGQFSYPTNIISRFYYAPYIGARIQQLLVDYDLKNEIFNQSNYMNYNSELGKTSGPLQPHEFWYFWKRFFKFKDIQKLNDYQIKNVNWGTLNKELHAFESVFDKPILMKAMNLNWHLIDLINNIQNVHIIFLKRDVIYNSQSLLLARKKFFGHYNGWYSFKPPSYEQLRTLPFTEQVVRQVEITNRDIENQLNKVDSKKIIKIKYEDFCNNPQFIFEKLGMSKPEKTFNISFNNNNKIKIEKRYFDEILKCT